MKNTFLNHNILDILTNLFALVYVIHALTEVT
jgi:hypothetical protein